MDLKHGSQLKHDRAFRKRSDPHHFHDSGLYADESSLSPPPRKLSSAQNGAISAGSIQNTEFPRMLQENFQMSCTEFQLIEGIPDHWRKALSGFGELIHVEKRESYELLRTLIQTLLHHSFELQFRSMG